MYSDLTIIYYTANRIHDAFANAVRKQLLEAIGTTPIVVVSHKPMMIPDATHIIVGDVPVSAYSVYSQILLGAKAAQTAYVACVEDDTLYPKEHFEYRPVGNVVAYDMNRWSITLNPPNPIFYWKDRIVMGQCIAPREYLVDVLEARFNKYPVYNPEMECYWGEPGRGRIESALKLPPVAKATYWGAVPTVAFKHRKSLGGVRNRRPGDTIVEQLAPWGKARDLWKRIYG